MAAEHAARGGLPVVLCAGLAVFMAQLDSTAANVALPEMRADFAVSPAAVSWVQLAYVVPMIGLSLLAGRWADGTSRRFAAQLVIGGFGAASAAVALAGGLVELLAARLVQGAFGAGLLALAPLLAVDAVADLRRGRAIGLVSGVGPLGAVVGAPLGGVLLELASWRAIFVINVPLAGALLVVLRRRLPAGRRPAAPRLSWVREAVLLTTAAALTVGALSAAADRGLPWLALLAGAALLGVRWWRGAGSDPVRALVRLPGMPSLHGAIAVAYVAALATQFVLPFLMKAELGSSPVRIGMALLVLPLAGALAAPPAGLLADRLGPGRVSAAGAALLVVGVALLGLEPAATGGPIAVPLALAGTGFALVTVPLQARALAAVPADRRGLVSATTNLARLCGLAAGPALATFAWALDGYRLGGLHIALAVAATFAASCVVLAARASTSDNRNRAKEQV